MEDLASFQAPMRPPSFLSESQLYELCSQGHLSISLPDHLDRGALSYFAASEEFFALPEKEKRSLYPAVSNSLEHGYHHLKSEKEFLTLRYRSVAENPPGVEKLLAEVWHGFVHLLYRILIDVGDFIDVPEVAWRSLVSNSLALPAVKTDTPSLLRTFRYEPLSGVADPHNDLGLLTICICRGSGLQVWQVPNSTESVSSIGETIGSPHSAHDTAATGQWNDAGEVTILVGDTLRALSDNRVRSGKHRVVANPEGRSSIVFALRPRTDSTIDLCHFGGEGQVDARVLWARIKGNRVNVNARKDIREEQRRKRQEHVPM